MCTMLGFCKTTDYVAAKPILPGIQLKPKVNVQEKPKAGELCDLCQMVINELDSMILKNSTTVGYFCRRKYIILHMNIIHICFIYIY